MIITYYVLKIWNGNVENLSRLVFNILLLADVFGKIRNYSRKNYRLCPSHYLGALALSCYPMFNMTKMELELLPNFVLYILFEKGTKGGISYIFNKYTKSLQKKANFMTKNKNHNILYT